MGDRLLDIIQCIASGEYSEADIAALRQALQRGEGQALLQLDKYNITIGSIRRDLFSAIFTVYRRRRRLSRMARSLNYTVP